MPDSHHRGRPRDRYYDDDYYHDDFYEPEPKLKRPPPKRSLSRKAMDKIEDTFASLGLTDFKDGHSNAPTHHRHYSPRRHRSHDRHHSPRGRRSHERARSHHSHKGYGIHGSHGSYKSQHSRRTYSESPTRHRRSRRDSDWDRDRTSSHRSRSRSAWEGSLKTAANAAAVEAFRLRKEPGSWTGAKASRIATAALSAAAIGAAADSGKPEQEKSKLSTVGGTIGGLMVNRIVNGPRRELR